MTYRSILTLLDQGDLCTDRTQFSIRLARNMNAHLTGWAATGLGDVPSSATAISAGADPSTMRWDVLRDNAERVTRIFLLECEGAGIRAETFIEDGDRAAGLVRQAHGNDLLVLTQADPSTASQTALRLLVEQAVLHCARPVLLLPYASSRVSTFTGTFDNAIVAWDDSREAARATADALPLLRRARRVRALALRESSSRDEKTEEKSLTRLTRWLERHGIRIEIHVEQAASGVTNSLLSRAAELEADLLVTGAYGHSRWAEHVLGGTTQGLLTSMTLPVLMSH